MGMLRCSEVSINYRCFGTGKNVVLIHGLAANQAFWNPLLVNTLVERYRVTVYDLRGHGYSSMPKSGYTSADMAEDLRLLLDEIADGPIHAVGHSFGGLVALHYALQHPQRVSSITLADVRVRALQPTQSSSDWPPREAARRILEECGMVVPDDVEEAGLWILEQLASPQWQQVREDLKSKIRHLPWGKSKRSADQWLALLQQTTARDDFLAVAGLTAEALATIEQPTLGLYGEYSPARRSLEGLIGILPHFQSEVIAGAGHFFPMGRPKLFADQVKAFLGDVDHRTVRSEE
ncbi:MAG TPA: alpha/beta hydrolase [Thermodesulfobacteriota bacterium]|nr:alpha/beta hydrolase [Deltaproteobacteria bacterium]HNR12292.1 alpha/beta hydrolase [Thermodesulfobacteriota bacterium]HNU70198.1 alpha/beta hydrolase [Thermodesulfobacteriota bacterium]HQO78721.1 alpha/beta hydrolase [Thermodesulfobacteriota bacterium]